MNEFLAMGGYGAYVWVSYGVTALLMVLLFIWSWMSARSRDAELVQVRKLSRAERRAPSTATLSGGANPMAEETAQGDQTLSEAGAGALPAGKSVGGAG